MGKHRFRTCSFLGFGPVLCIFACSGSGDRPLSSRGLPVEKKYEYAESGGYVAPRDVRTAFLEGYVVRGMPREWVIRMYGVPDRVTDVAWEYRGKKGSLVTGITFRNELVDSIYGDSTGGAWPGRPIRD